MLSLLSRLSNPLALSHADLTERNGGDGPLAPTAEERAIHDRFVDAGHAIGLLVVEGGYLPSLKDMGRVFERLYSELAPLSMDRPDMQAWLARGFLTGMQSAGFEPPYWMRSEQWLRWLLTLPERSTAH